MKLRAKIYSRYLKDILEGKKTIEFRQIESIVLTDPDGTEFEFMVTDLDKVDRVGVRGLMLDHPDVPWDPALVTVAIEVGKRIR